SGGSCWEKVSDRWRQPWVSTFNRCTNTNKAKAVSARAAYTLLVRCWGYLSRSSSRVLPIDHHQVRLHRAAVTPMSWVVVKQSSFLLHTVLYQTHCYV